jgi:hypothetical protein
MESTHGKIVYVCTPRGVEAVDVFAVNQMGADRVYGRRYETAKRAWTKSPKWVYGPVFDTEAAARASLEK